MVLDKVPERTFVATYRFICRTANCLQPDRVYKYLVCLEKHIMGNGVHVSRRFECFHSLNHLNNPMFTSLQPLFGFLATFFCYLSIDYICCNILLRKEKLQCFPCNTYSYCASLTRSVPATAATMKLRRQSENRSRQSLWYESDDIPSKKVR